MRMGKVMMEEEDLAEDKLERLRHTTLSLKVTRRLLDSHVVVT